MKKKKASAASAELNDSDIRRLVIKRIESLSPDTIKSIGSKGTFSRAELLKHVNDGDEIGHTIERIELEWLQAMKDGVITQLNQQAT